VDGAAVLDEEVVDAGVFGVGDEGVAFVGGDHFVGGAVGDHDGSVEAGVFEGVGGSEPAVEGDDGVEVGAGAGEFEGDGAAEAVADGGELVGVDGGKAGELVESGLGAADHEGAVGVEGCGEVLGASGGGYDLCGAVHVGGEGDEAEFGEHVGAEHGVVVASPPFVDDEDARSCLVLGECFGHGEVAAVCAAVDFVGDFA